MSRKRRLRIGAVAALLAVATGCEGEPLPDAPGSSAALASARPAPTIVDSSPKAPPQALPPALDVSRMDASPFHVVAKANAAKGYGVVGGFVTVDGMEYLAAAAGEPIRRGSFLQPANTTSRWVVERITGALPDGLWVSFHTEVTGSTDGQGTRRFSGGVLQPGGSEQQGTWVSPWLEGRPLALEAIDGRDGARLRSLADGRSIDVAAPQDSPQARCVDTFRTTRFVANEAGFAAAAGSCVFDEAPSQQKRKLAVLRWSLISGEPDAGAGAARFAVRAEPLPGTHQEDRVTGLVVRSDHDILVSVIRRGHATAPARIFQRDADGAWNAQRTPVEAPAIAISAAPGGPLWVASPSEVWRHLGTDRWERVPLPSIEAMSLQRQPNISTLWVSGPDDVWIIVGHGARVLRTKPVDALLELGAR